MSGKPPGQIWQEGLDEGERRLKRGNVGLMATGLVGGFDVAVGLLAFMVTKGTLETMVTPEIAKTIGSVAFGIGFVFIAIGRSELFTENFLVPVAAVMAQRGTRYQLVWMWFVTMVFNFIGLALVSVLLIPDETLIKESLEAAGEIANRFAERDVVAAFTSAILAGAVMTLFTWLLAATTSDGAKVIIALLVGFLLAAPALNHAVVGFGEIVFGMVAGTANSDVNASLLVTNTLIAIVGNLVGGLGWVTLTRLFQVSGEVGSGPDRGEGDMGESDAKGQADTAADEPLSGRWG
ncbi:MAG: formate/nitrite transporter family protein [Solirubrobacterales bacterium]